MFFNLKSWLVHRKQIQKSKSTRKYTMHRRSASTILSLATVYSLLCLDSSTTNLKAREYVARYNPLRLFHVAASELSKPCQTFVAVCSYLSADRAERKYRRWGRKSFGEPQDIFSPCVTDIHLFSSNSPSIYMTTSF
jgi:hypothetical protein